MPTYTVEIPGQGTYDVESPHDLTDEQAYQIAVSQGGASPQPDQRKPGTYESYYGGEGFAGATGRRVGAAFDAFADLPTSALGIVTGGQHGRLDAVLRTLQGIGAPFNLTTAPIEAGIEQGLEAVGVPENYSRLGGDVAGIASAFGVGALAKAGKFGEPIQLLSKSMGMGRATNFEDAVKRDPHLRFIMEREPTIGASNLEIAARGDKSIEELALELGRPEMAKVSLAEKAEYQKSWQEWAKNNHIISDLPEETQVKFDKIIFDNPQKKDWNLFTTLGTPATRAAATDPLGAAIANETLLTEIGIKKAITSREARTTKAITGLTDEEARRAVITRSLMEHEDIMEASEERVPQSIKNFIQYLRDKSEVDRQIAIPRMRDRARDKIARDVKRDMGDAATEAEMVAEVNKRVLKAVPDSTGLDEAVLQMFPGFYKIKDKHGTILKEADTGLGWKMEVEDLARQGIDPKELTVEAQAYLDSDLLSRYKGRVKRSLNHLANGLTPSKDEIMAAAQGEYITQKGWKLMGLMKGESGNPKGYAKDLQDMLYTVDRSFERWLQVNDLQKKTQPMLKELEKRYPTMARDLGTNIKTLWGHRMPGSEYLDNLLAATPLLRDVVSPMALERWSQAGKTGIVNLMLKFSPRFHAVNSTQLAQTLLPILDSSDELMQGIKLYRATEGVELLKRHGVSELGSKIESFTKGLGPTEKWNQEIGFLTMYNRARKFGLTDGQAAGYAKLRGNVYSQFLGLTTDQPMAFRKLDPTGLLLMFKRFPVKQMELVIDLVKDRNLPGVAKWLGVNLALGGFKAATFGGSGWLTYKLYKQIESEYGKGVADVFHTGLPAIIGGDISGSVQLFDPPFGENLGEQLTNFAKGPIIGLASSAFGAAMNQQAVDPIATRRVIHAIADKNPLLKGLYQLFQDDIYDFRDTAGRLKWKGDAADVIKTFMGLKPAGGVMGQMEGPDQMKPAELDTFIEAFMEVTQKRGNVLDYVASRYGAAQAAGIDLGKDMEDAIKKEVDNWNNLWPEFPILGEDIKERAKRRAQSVREGTGKRVMRSGPQAVKNAPIFQAQQQEQVPPPPGQLPFEFFPGGG